MSTLRDDLIKLAHSKPELQEHLLPLVVAHEEAVVQSLTSLDNLADVEAATKTARSEHARKLYDRRGVSKISRKLRGEDDQARQMVLEILTYVEEQLISPNEDRALNMLNNLAANAERSDVATIRNQLGKIANLLGLRTPVGF